MSKAKTKETINRVSPDVGRKLYFVNEIVEWQLTSYIWTGCTKVRLRDQIMSHATELIRQIIRKQGLHTIYPGQEESAFGDLLQTAWVQIERTLYKYRACPHCRICFNYDRPSDSFLYKPQNREYGIVTIDDIVKSVKRCPKCGTKLDTEPFVEPIQGRYGGSETVLYRGMSKVFNMWCIAPDSILLSSEGILSIQDVVDGKIQHIYGAHGFKPINGYLEKPLQDCIKLTTIYNYNITASPEHKFLCLENDGPCWKHVEEIDIGDLLGIQFDQQVFFNEDIIDCSPTKRGNWVPPNKFTEELGYIIGLFIAEGSYSYNKLVMYNIDEDVINSLCNNSLGLNFIHEPQYQRVSLCNVRFIEFLRWLGFGSRTDCDTKFIPQKLLKTSKPILSSVIRGMFDGDGHSRISDGNVGYTSTSKILIDQLRMLLMNFGMLSKISITDRLVRDFGQYVSKLKIAYQLLLSSEFSERFYLDIGFGIRRKHYNHTNLVTVDSDIHNYDSRLFCVNDKFRLLHQTYGPGSLGYDKIRTVLKGNYCKLGTAVSVLKSWSAHADDVNYQYIMDRINERQDIVNKIIWLPIRDIQETQSRLCEISVDSEDHSYIANGFVSHNSQIARTVILAYIKKEARDRKNSGSYMTHLSNKPKPISDIMVRFLAEAREICKYHEDYQEILNALEWLMYNDDRPHDGIIGKLVQRSGLSRTTVTGFMKHVKLRSIEFTDSPISRSRSDKLAERPRRSHDFDFDD